MTTREQWLMAAAKRMAAKFDELGAPLPAKVRISIGFTSGGKRGRSIGECWYPPSSADGHHEIFIRPSEAGDVEVLAILAHELAHTAAGHEAKHGRAFKKLVDGLGLDSAKGRQGCKATTAGPEFKVYAEKLVAALGPIPHARLNASQLSTAPKKQTTRLLKCECPECGYICRTTATWLRTAGAPICPSDAIPLQHPDLPDLGGDDDGDEEDAA